MSLSLGAGCAPSFAQTPDTQTPPAATAVPGQLSPPAAELYRRMTAVNAQLRSYKAKVHATVVLRSFLGLSKSLDGTLYYHQPDRQAVVFDTAPVLAKEFQKVYPRVDAPVDWPKIYVVSSLASEGGFTTFRLVPRKHGRVLHLDVRVDEASATIRGYTWTYEDGGDVTFEQTVVLQSGFQLVTGHVGRVNLPAYKADVTTTIGDYELNVPIADSVFTPAPK